MPMSEPNLAKPSRPVRAIPNSPMTRHEFDRFLTDQGESRSGVSQRHGRICLAPPYVVIDCVCGDVNCHGWRIVPQVG
jgi:hypothetical protein